MSFSLSSGFNADGYSHLLVEKVREERDSVTSSMSGRTL